MWRRCRLTGALRFFCPSLRPRSINTSSLIDTTYYEGEGKYRGTRCADRTILALRTEVTMWPRSSFSHGFTESRVNGVHVSGDASSRNRGRVVNPLLVRRVLSINRRECFEFTVPELSSFYLLSRCCEIRNAEPYLNLPTSMITYTRVKAA